MLLRQTAQYVPAQVLGPIFLFAALLVWTHWLTPEELGVYTLVAATQEFCNLFAMLWFSVFGLRYYKDQVTEQSQQRYLATERAILLGVGAVIAIITLLLFTTITDIKIDLNLIASAFAFMVSRTVSIHLAERARADGKILTYTILQIAGPVFGLGAGLALCTLIAPQPQSVFWGYALAQIVGILISIPALKLKFERPHLDPELTKSALKYGIPIAIGGALSWVALNGVRFIVEHFGSLQAVGLMAVGWGLGQRGAAFGSMLATAASFPLAVNRLREEGKDAAEDQMGRNGLLLWGLLAPTIGGIIAIAEPLVSVLVATPFQAITQTILPAAVIAGVAYNLRMHFYAQYFLLFERTHVPAIIDLIEAVTVIALCSYGMIYHGIYGAVLGAMTGTLLGLVVVIIWAMKDYDVRLPYRELLAVTLAAVAMATAVTAIPGAPSPLLLIIKIVVGMALYPTLLALFSPTLLRELLSKLKSRRNNTPTDNT